MTNCQWNYSKRMLVIWPWCRNDVGFSSIPGIFSVRLKDFTRVRPPLIWSGALMIPSPGAAHLHFLTALHNPHTVMISSVSPWMLIASSSSFFSLANFSCLALTLLDRGLLEGKPLPVLQLWSPGSGWAAVILLITALHVTGRRYPIPHFQFLFLRLPMFCCSRYRE